MRHRVPAVRMIDRSARNSVHPARTCWTYTRTQRIESESLWISQRLVSPDRVQLDKRRKQHETRIEKKRKQTRLRMSRNIIFLLSRFLQRSLFVLASEKFLGVRNNFEKFLLKVRGVSSLVKKAQKPHSFWGQCEKSTTFPRAKSELEIVPSPFTYWQFLLARKDLVIGVIYSQFHTCVSVYLWMRLKYRWGIENCCFCRNN